jgi:hypothetical protein
MRPRTWALLALLPVLALALNVETAYWLDMDAFERWARGVHRGRPAPSPTAPAFANVYLDTDCNYPPLGAVFSAGALRAIDSLSRTAGLGLPRHRLAFRGYLLLFEIAALLMSAALFSALSLPQPGLAAAALYLLPSSWAGGAVWGQVDIVAQAFLLLAAYAFVSVIVDERPRPGLDVARIATGAWALSSALLVKQLALFSLPGLAGLLVVALATVQHRRGWRACLPAAALAAGVAGAWFLLLDRAVFAVPRGHAGITAYVWSTGSDHSRYLFANGPNVWTFLATRNLFPSDLPFYGSLTPRRAGFTVAMAVCLALGSWLALHGFPVLRRRARFEAHRHGLAAALLAFVGLLNLVVPVLVTGTHERYFFHAFPFLMLGFAGWRARRDDVTPAGSLLWIAAAGCISGCFVYSIMRPEAFRLVFPLRSQAFTASVLLGAAAVLALRFVLAVGRLRDDPA